MKKLAVFVRKHYKKPLIMVGFLLAWQMFIVITGVKEYIVPSPLATFGRLFDPETAAQYKWLMHIRATVSEIIIAFSVTALSGITVAILITWSNLLRGVITPVLTLLNSLPKIALAPLFVLWFGYGLVPNIMIAVLIGFFPVIINTAAGLNAVDEDLLDLVRYLHGTKWQIFSKIRIPNSLPYMFAGFRISSTLCVVGVIVGEFVASSKGLGYLIRESQAMIDTPTMFASLILLSILGLSLFGIISALEKVFIHSGGIELT